MDRTLITGVINLDMCGYGDALAVCGKGHEKKPAVRAFCQRDRLKKYNGELLRYLPKSDDASFSGSRDSVEYIEPETMEKMYEYLLESVTAKDEEQTTGGLFGRFMKRRENS